MFPRAASTASSAPTISASAASSPATRNRSLKRCTCGEVVVPAEWPAASSSCSANAVVEPLPLVPATVIVVRAGGSTSRCAATSRTCARPRFTPRGCSTPMRTSQSDKLSAVVTGCPRQRGARALGRSSDSEYRQRRSCPWCAPGCCPPRPRRHAVRSPRPTPHP